MDEKVSTNDGFGPHGICHRLFNFIVNSFLSQCKRRLTSGINNAASPHNDGSQSLVNKKDQNHVIRPDGYELPVEFRHANDAKVNRTINTSGQVMVQENANKIQARKKTGSQDQGNGNGGRDKTMNKTSLIIVDGGNLPGRKHHLLNVTSNINEKADAFIRSRKEAMEKAISMKQSNDV